jgi:membrane protein YdbS with pleckstrin-like domain
MSVPVTERVARLQGEAIAAKVEAKALSKSYDESTSLSWLWAFLFGPIYFAVHGFWARAFVLFLLNIVFIGIVVGPFMAYPAWRKRAEEAARQHLLIDGIRQRA